MKNEFDVTIRGTVLLVGLFAAMQSVITAGCASKGRTPSGETSEYELINQVWQWQRRQIALAATTNSMVDLARFQQAVRFFEKNTGISYESGSDVGKLPSPELRVTLGKWDAWYEANGHRLRLNWNECLLLEPTNTSVPSVP